MNYVRGLITVFVIVLFSITGASDGDERPEFASCVKSCSIEGKCQLDRVLRLTGWDCEADCKYRCMRADLQKRRSSCSSGHTVQYYGKWPFIRVFGAQELFSVIFSLGNFLACLYGYFYYYRPTTLGKAKRTHWMTRVHFLSFLITSNTWLQSAIFHYRDTPLTEKLDYFSACLCIMSTVPVALIRIWKIRTVKMQLILVAPFVAVYLHHIWYMSFVLFDYGYHVKFNAVFGILSNHLWMSFAYKLPQTSPIKRPLGWFVVLNICSMIMVAVDFPPLLDLIDMHALWHLSTIPITLMWYKLISIDSQSLKHEKKMIKWRIK